MPAKPALWDLFKRSWHVASIFSICFHSHTEELAKNKKSKKTWYVPFHPLWTVLETKKNRKSKNITFRCENRSFVVLARIVAAGDHVTHHTVRLLKQGHLEGDCRPITTFSKQKILKLFCKRTNKIKDSNMQPLKTLKPFQLTWTLGKQSSNFMNEIGPFAKKNW